MNPEIEQAFRDLLEGRVCLDPRGNYRLKVMKDDRGFTLACSQAPWNKTVRREFINCPAFCRAAIRWQEQTQ